MEKNTEDYDHNKIDNEDYDHNEIENELDIPDSILLHHRHK